MREREVMAGAKKGTKLKLTTHAIVCAVLFCDVKNLFRVL